MNFFLFNKTLLLCLVLLNIFSFPMHEYAALEIDILSSSYYSDSPVNQDEEIIQDIMKEFKIDAESRGYTVDFSRLTFKIHTELGRDQVFLDRTTTIYATCDRIRQHVQFLKRELNSFSLVRLRASVYHELGHCSLNLGHEEDLFNQEGIPNILATFSSDLPWEAFPEYVWTLSVNKMFNEISNSI